MHVLWVRVCHPTLRRVLAVTDPTDGRHSTSALLRELMPLGDDLNPAQSPSSIASRLVAKVRCRVPRARVPGVVDGGCAS